MATKTYTAQTTIHHGTTADDQRVYQPGDAIDLSDEHAAPLLACGAVAGPVKTQKPAK